MTSLPLRSPVQVDMQAPGHLQIIAHAKTHQKVVEIFANFTHRGTLLESPGGEGALAMRLQELGYTVTAGDIDPSFFKVPTIPCLFLDMNRKFPIENDQFHFVSCIEGIEHLQDQFRFIRECHRVLKTDGILVLSTPNILNLASRLKFLFSGFYSLVPKPINEFSKVPVFDHINPATYYQLRYMLHTQGFEITHVATDFFRRSAMGLCFLRPLSQLYSKRTMRKESDPQQRRANRDIRRVLASPNILFGRTLILVARKRQNQGIPTIQASEV